MEEKEDALHSRVWSFFSRWNISKLFIFSSSSSKNSGFTLIELLVVIGVVGALVTGLITLINPAGQINRSKDGKTKSDLKQIQGVLELYRSDCGSYPNPSGSSLPSPLTSTCVSSTPTTYMQNVPTGPLGAYTYSLAGSTYTLTGCVMDKNAALNATSDPKVISSNSCSSGKALQVTSP